MTARDELEKLAGGLLRNDDQDEQTYLIEFLQTADGAIGDDESEWKGLQEETRAWISEATLQYNQEPTGMLPALPAQDTLEPSAELKPPTEPRMISASSCTKGKRYLISPGESTDQLEAECYRITEHQVTFEDVDGDRYHLPRSAFVENFENIGEDGEERGTEEDDISSGPDMIVEEPLTPAPREMRKTSEVADVPSFVPAVEPKVVRKVRRSTTHRAKELICLNPKASQNQIKELLRKDGRTFKDGSITTLYSEVHSVMQLMDEIREARENESRENE